MPDLRRVVTDIHPHPYGLVGEYLFVLLIYIINSLEVWYTKVGIMVFFGQVWLGWCAFTYFRFILN